VTQPTAEQQAAAVRVVTLGCAIGVVIVAPIVVALIVGDAAAAVYGVAVGGLTMALCSLAATVFQWDGCPRGGGSSESSVAGSWYWSGLERSTA
jgi:hypothetical protein